MSKFYLPNNLINNAYNYQLSNETIIVHTNRNCYTQYNTTYCDCINVSPRLDYLVSNSYSCSNNFTNVIDKSQFTNDYMYSVNFPSSLIIATFLIIFFIYLPYKIISRMFGRWLKI